MTIRTRLTRKMVLTGAATALVIGATAGTALAVTATWTVTPGGAFSFSGAAKVKDVTNPAHVTASCTSVKMAGTLGKGKGLSGTGIGTITSASFSGCKIATLAVTVTTNGLPWKMNATSFNKTSGTTTGSISGIDLVAAGTGCNATLDGTAAGANDGVTKITYKNSTAKITLLGPGGNLHTFGVAPGTCFGVLMNGDVQQASGSGLVTPKQTITSP